jgi:hypothetical protein
LYTWLYALLLPAAAQQQSAGTGDVNLTGVSATGAVGTIAKTVQPTLAGTLATGAVGTVGKTASKTLTGVAATGSAGTIGKTATKSLSGVLGTGAVGTAIASVRPAVTGVQGSGAVGTIQKTDIVRKTLTGVQGSGVVGAIGKTILKQLVGVQATGAVGTITAVQGVTLTLASVQATGAAGTIAKTAAKTPTGVQGSGAVGNLTKFIDKTLGSVAGTGAIGTMGVDTGSSFTDVNVPGVQATGAAGSISRAIAGLLQGVSGAGAAGHFPEPLEPGMPGVIATGLAGNLTASVLGWSHAAQDRGELWRPVQDISPEGWSPQAPDTLDVWFSNSKSKSMSGVEAAGQVGIIDVEVASDNPTISKSLTGVAASGRVGTTTMLVRKDGIGTMTGVQALMRAGAIGTQIQSSPPTIRPKLTWDPAFVAPLANPTVVDIPVAGLTRTFGAAEDVLLRAPNAKITGKVEITGGRNFNLIGGAAEMVSNGQDAPGGTIDLRFAHQFQFNGYTGSLFIQGLELDRKGSIGSGIWYASAAEGTGNVYIQDCRILNINGIDGAGNLIGNAIVGAGPFGTVSIDRITFSTANVGLFLATRHQWTGGTSAIRVKNVNGYVLTPGANVTSVRMFTLRESCTAGTNDTGTDLTTPITLDECYIEVGASGEPFIDTVVPNAPTHGACGAVEVTSTNPDTLDWPASSNISGVVKKGVPAAGDFVPAGAAGLNYVSPGYLPNEVSTTVKPIYYNGVSSSISAEVLAAYNMKRSTYISGSGATDTNSDGVWDGATAAWLGGSGLSRVTTAMTGYPVSIDWEGTGNNSGCTGNYARDLAGFGSAACQDKAETQGLLAINDARTRKPYVLWGFYDVPRSNEPGSFLAPSAAFMDQVNVISANFLSRCQVIHQRCYVTYARVSSGGNPLGADTATVAQVQTMLENMAKLGHQCADKAATVPGTPRPLVIPYCSVEYYNGTMPGGLHNTYVQDMEWLYYWVYYYVNYVHTDGRKADGVYVWTRSSAPINSEAQIKAIYQAVNGLPFNPNMPRPTPPST